MAQANAIARPRGASAGWLGVGAIAAIYMLLYALNYWLPLQGTNYTTRIWDWSQSSLALTLLFTGAAYYLPYLPSDVTDQFMHLGYHVLILSTQSPDVEATKPLLYGTVFVLLALTFLLNLTGVLIRSRTRSRLRG